MSWADINSNDRGNILGVSTNPWQTTTYGQNPVTPTNPSQPTQPATGTPPANWQDWYSQYGGQYPWGGTPTHQHPPTWNGGQYPWGGTPTQQTPTTPAVTGFTAPTTTMSVEDFSNWLQNNLANQSTTASGNYNANVQAAQQAQQQAFNNYANAVTGYQGAAGDLYSQMAQALGNYNDFDFNNMLMTGEVPEATKQYYQQIRDATVANLQSDLDKQFNDTFGPLKERLAASGTWDSTLGSRAVGDLMGEVARLMAQGSNTANATYAQNMINAPYRMMEGAGANLGNVLQSLAQQGGMASSVLAPLINQFAMSGDMANLSREQLQTYLSPLTQMYSDLLNAETARSVAQAQMDSQANAADQSSDAAMWSAIGSLVGGLF